MAYRYKTAMNRSRRTAFQRRDVKSALTAFRQVAQRGACGQSIPRYAIKARQ